MDEICALKGIKVIDLVTVAGPGSFCSTLLADMGADVTIIDAPPGARGPTRQRSQRDYLYQLLRRNKRSIALNLKSEIGRDLFYQLAKDADVIIDGFRPGVVKRLGIDYETISQINSGIVYCSITGYGQDGPYSHVLSHDINNVGMGGALGLIGLRDGPPVLPLTLVGDFGGSGAHACIGILTALLARDRLGKGQYIDIATTDCVVWQMSFFIERYFYHGVDLKRGETTFGAGYPYYNIYQTKDGKYITIGAIEAHLWANLCRALDREEYIPYSLQPNHLDIKTDDPKYDEIRANFIELFHTKTRDEWFELLKDKDIEIGKVYSITELINDPQIRHRQMIIEIEHPTEGMIKQTGIPIKLSATPGKIRRLSPSLGENTGEIMAELGYHQSDVDRLRQEGVVA